MAWKIKFSATARKSISKLDKPIALRITRFLSERVSPLENPRTMGQALTGAVFGSYWRYRLGDYRLICDIQDEVLCILVIDLGNRKEIYD